MNAVPDCGIKVHTLFSQMTVRIDYIVLVAHYELQINVSSEWVIPTCNSFRV
jgi:hypothetical protein